MTRAAPVTDVHVELRGVVRRYSTEVAALSGVDLVLRRQQSVAVVGRSGSGKSTLLNILGLLDRPDEGEVLVDGRRVDQDGDARRSQRRAGELGFVFQRAHLLGGLTTLENVVLGLRYARWPENTIHPRAEQALHDVGLEHRVHALARTLSGGEMQRVAIARTLARPARLWLADEPTGNLDSSQSQEIIDLLRDRAAERGVCLVVVTHEPDVAARMDRVVTLLDGRVVDDTSRGQEAAAVAVAETPEPVRERSAPTPPLLATALLELPSSPGLPPGRARIARPVLQALSAYPRRAGVQAAAVALAVALSLSALGLGQSAEAQVSGLFDARRANEVTASLVLPPGGRTRWPLRWDVVADYPGVNRIEHWDVRSTVDVSNGDLAATTAQLVRADAAPGAATRTEVTWAAAADGTLGPGEVLLGEALAERIAITQLDLQPEVVVAGAPLRVVGLVRTSRAPTAAGSAFVSGTEGLDVAPPITTEVYVETAPGAARQVADRLPGLVDPFGTTQLSVEPVLGADAYRGGLESSVAVSLRILSVVAALTGLLVVVFVNVLTVGARGAEFGVRRAFGARRRDLVLLVLGESVVASLLGAVLGVALGFLAIMAVTISARWLPVFDPRLLVVGAVAAVAFAVAGGLVPAVVAGRVQPADAVRS